MTTHINGMDMHVDDRGDGPPLVLLHGFTGCSGDWVHVFDLDALAREFRVIAPDLRGHGRTTNPGGAFSHRQCASDVLALLDELGVARFRAIGVSLGGNTLLHLATRQPARVEAMVLAGSPPYFPAQARAIMASMTEDTRSEAEWRTLRERHHHGDDQIRALWRHAREFAEHHDDMCFTPPLLATITARTLLVNGDRDPLYPVELFVDLYRAIPETALWIVPHGGHAPVFEAHRDAFAAAALTFLRG